MDETLPLDSSPEEVTDLESAIDTILSQIKLCREQMAADGREIDRLKAHSRALKAESDALRAETRVLLDVLPTGA